jgi:hypothetical protein
VAERRPREIVDEHEASIGAEERRSRGAHYTPEDLAGRIVEHGFSALGRTPARVCDPSCGAGSVLLAAADRLSSEGLAPREVIEDRLVGFDIDSSAVRAARCALEEWAKLHGAAGVRPVVHRADSLEFPRIPTGADVDLVCGNPPFLGQLRRRTLLDGDLRARVSARWPQIGAYTDAAALHLLAALDLVAPGGVVALLQPRSVLGSRDAAPIREAVATRGALKALWAASDAQFSGTSVGVCLPVIRLDVDDDGCASTGAGSIPARVELTMGDASAIVVAAPSPPSDWAALLARLEGVPAVAPTVETVPLGELVDATAGFRDEFYELAGVAVEGPDGGYPLVSVGMIDPAELRWGHGDRRLGGRRMSAPVVPEELLGPHASGPSAWARRRLVPKVLVATQTRVLEAVLDVDGRLVPLTPVISVELAGGEDGSERGWLLRAIAAALSAPCTTALMASRVAGTGLARDVLRPTARVVESLPIPARHPDRQVLVEAWLELERRLSRGRPGTDDWISFGRRCDAAYGLADEELVEWWWQRHPARRRAAL